VNSPCCVSLFFFLFCLYVGYSVIAYFSNNGDIEDREDVVTLTTHIACSYRGALPTSGEAQSCICAGKRCILAL
jgi:hypothetical protein